MDGSYLDQMRLP